MPEVLGAPGMYAILLALTLSLALLWPTNGEEILVQPFSQVRIECKPPNLTPTNHRSFQWNFARTVSASGSAKHNTLCFDFKCPEQTIFGYQLEVDNNTGAYDLIFSNVTYELNDGLYYCRYRDPNSKLNFEKEHRLTVLIAPQAPIILPATQTPAREGLEYHLNCQSQGGNPEPNITWFRNDQLVGPQPGLRVEQSRTNETTTSTLSWIPTMDDHQALYRCVVWNKAMSPMLTYERELRLQVEYAPRINVGPFNPLKVLIGSPFTLPCQVEANPPVKSIHWFKDGRSIGNQYNHTILEAKISDSSIYSCQADNGIPPIVGSAQLALGHAAAGQAIGPASSFLSLFGIRSNPAQSGNSDQISGTAVEAQLQVQVLYPPRVQVKPSKVAPLNEGDYFTLNCSVESWPPAHEFLWTRQDDPTFRRLSPAQSGSYLEFQSITAGDMGNYTCTAFNRMEPSGMHQSPPLERQGSASGLVMIRHKPGLAEISVGQGGETELGAKTQILCRAKPPGYPEAMYKFWKYQGINQNQKLHLNKQAHGPVYTIYSAKADDEAKYGCAAFNEMGVSTEADADLIVNEPPIIIHDTSARRDEDSRPQGDFPYSITVRASGKPEPKVSWFHRSPVDGKRIELSWAEMRARFKIETISTPEQNQMRPKYNVVSTLSFRNPLEVDDRGLYTVEFSNGLSRTAIEEFQLHINHAPVPAPRNHPILASQQATGSAAGAAGGSQQQQLPRIKAGFELGETVNLTCRVSAHPKPAFVWITNNAQETGVSIESNPRYKTIVTNPRDDIWESTLTFPQAQESDYGEYMCTTANYAVEQQRITDSIQIIVVLSHKSPPDAPLQLEPVDATQDSITIQWIPGFDGGFALNQYLVQYAPDDGSGLSLSKRYPGADSLGVVMASPAGYQQQPVVSNAIDEQQPSQLGYPKLYDCLSMNPCTINQLLPRQAYVFRVRAKNELGLSEFSEELRASTRANISQIPKIMVASLDAAHNVLHFRIEPGSDYLLNNLNARIEYRSLSPSNNLPQMDSSPQMTQANSLPDQIPGQQEAPQAANSPLLEWKPLTSAHIRQEKVEALLAIQPDMDQLKITLCSRSNDSLCGPEYVVSIKSATSSFLQEQRGLSLTIMFSTITLIIVLAVFATTVHSCCLSRRNKKADAIERIDGGGGGGGIDNKPVSANGATNKSSHGSTTSTNSTSAGNGTGSNGLQSMDSINGALNGGLSGGSNSDHSSDHSRQAKLDTMIPPNYNHYADRASIMMEQHHHLQQQQQLMQQQQGLMSADKLSSPFGLQNSALLSVANHQQQSMPSPMMNGGSLNHFSYGHQQQQIDPHQQQPMSLDQHHGSMMDANMMLSSGLEPATVADGQQQMWSANQMDDYNNYNALASYTSQHQDQMIDPTYVTTGSVMMSQHSAAYDNSANSGQFQAYLSAYQQPAQSHESAQQQRAQFQQGMAVAQQQIYGTLTRKNYTGGGNASSAASELAQNNSTNQQLMEQQQQQLLDQQQQYSTTNGLVQPPPPPMSQESDYATTGARSGRLIREIIV